MTEKNPNMEPLAPSLGRARANIAFIVGIALGVLVTVIGRVGPWYIPQSHELLGYCIFIQATLFVIDFVAKDMVERAASTLSAISISNLSFALYQVGAIVISFISQRA